MLLSFDIDGTLETGDPPGPVTLDMVRRAKELGCLIGSASDRSISAQKDMWERNNIEVDFVSQKHVLIDIRHRFEADYYLHMGDRELDRQFALEAEFNFLWMHEAATEPWIDIQNGITPLVPGGVSGNAVPKVVPAAVENVVQSPDPSVSSEGVRPPQFSTADCRGAKQDVNWCDTHHQPIWECKSYEAGLRAPQKEPDGLS